MSGLIDEISKSAIQPTKIDLTPESLKELFVQCAMNDAMSNRQFVVMTGLGGHQMLTDTMEKEAYRRILEDEKEKYPEDHSRLLDMINSEDRENFELAKIIIKQRK